jgi:hypothetical protein
MAEAGYIMGLSTIGEVATHMELHYDLHFSLDNYHAEVAEFNAVIEGHLDDSIELYLSAEDKKKMDDELDAAMRGSPDAPGTPPEDFGMT